MESSEFVLCCNAFQALNHPLRRPATLLTATGISQIGNWRLNTSASSGLFLISHHLIASPEASLYPRGSRTSFALAAL